MLAACGDIQHHAVRLDRAKEEWILHRKQFSEIDRPSKQRFEIREHSEALFGVYLRRRRVEHDEEVEVASPGVNIGAGCGPEQLQ
jgi:hypothetical protein